MGKSGRGTQTGAASDAAERARRDAGAQPRDIAADDLETWASDTRGVSRGVERPEHAGPQQAPPEREGVDAAAVASFTKELAEMASADPEDPAFAHQDDELLLGGEFDRAEELLTTPRAARKETVEQGGDDPPAEEEADAPVADAPPDAPAATPSPIPRLLPKARVAWLGLDEVLMHAAEHDLLVGWAAELALARIPALPAADWLGLVEAFRLCGTRTTAAAVLKALAGHTPGRALPPFAEHVAELGDAEVLVRLARRGPAPDPEAPTARAIRMHHDPVAALADQPLPDEIEATAEWSVPRWLRGVPRVPVDFALLAVDMALTNDLRPGFATDGGATDPLTAALAPSGATHPSLQRWLLTLSARAESRSDLCAMRDALLRARAEMTSG